MHQGPRRYQETKVQAKRLAFVHPSVDLVGAPVLQTVRAWQRQNVPRSINSKCDTITSRLSSMRVECPTKLVSRHRLPLFMKRRRKAPVLWMRWRTRMMTRWRPQASSSLWPRATRQTKWTVQSDQLTMQRAPGQVVCRQRRWGGWSSTSRNSFY